MNDYHGNGYPPQQEPVTPAYGSYPGGTNYYGGGSRLDFKKSFNQLLQVLRRGAWIIVLVFALVAGAVTAVTLTMEPEYVASSLMLIEDSGPSSARNEALNFGVVGGAGVDQSKSTQTLILKESIAIAERTVERLMQSETIPGTGDLFTFLDEKESLMQTLGGAEPTLTDWASYVQKQYVRIAPEGDWRVGGIRIAVTSAHPVEAAMIANTYAEEYVDLSKEISRERIVDSRSFLEARITETRFELAEIENEITAYQRSEGAIALGSTSQLTVTQLAQYRNELSQANIDKRVREASVATMESQLAEITPRLAQGLSAGVEEEITKTRDRISQIETLLEPIYRQNPDLRTDPSNATYVQRLVDQLEREKSTLADLSERLVTGSISPDGSPSTTGGESVEYASGIKERIAEERVAIAGLDSKIQELRRAIVAQSSQLDSIPQKNVHLQQLERQRRSVETKLLDLQDNLQDARIAEESQVGFARVLRPAFIPTVPEKPNKPRSVFLGCLLGLMLGIGASIVKHWLDTRIYSPEDIVSRGITLLGAVPDMKSMIKTQFANATTSEWNGKEVSTSLATLLVPASPVAEAYRRLYVNLQFSMPDKVVQTILVTSPEAEVGKSTTSLNLAITAARAKRKTLIIDADFHRPAVARYLGIGTSSDMREVLKDIGDGSNRALEEPLFYAADKRGYDPVRAVGNGDQQLDVSVFETGVENLYALAAEKPIPDSAELLGSREFRQLLFQMREVFDVIIVDTPPVLLTADAAVVATQMDAVVLVASAGSTDAAALEHSINELQHIGANVLGAVINRFDPSSVPGYKYTYKYRYQYYHKYYSGGARPALQENA